MIHLSPTACPICGSADFRRVAEFAFGDWRRDGDALTRRRFSYEVAACTVCDHLLARHGYGPDFIRDLYTRPQEAEVWSLDPADDGLAAYRDMIAYAGPEIARTDGRVVDVGCGRGDLLRVLAAAHPDLDLLGVDYVPPADIGVPTAPLALEGLGRDGPTPIDGFAGAFCTHVLEHMADPRTFLTALRARAGQGAWLYLEAPDHADDSPAVARHSNLFNAQHIQYFTRRSLVRLAESCGWAVVRADSTLTGFTPRARLLAVAARDGSAEAATRTLFDRIAADTDRAAERIRRALGDGPVLLWGTGGDCVRLLDRHPDLAGRVGSDITLVDRDLAGGRYLGATVQGPDMLPGFPGAIFVTPRAARTRTRMLEAAAAMGIDRARLEVCFDD